MIPGSLLRAVRGIVVEWSCGDEPSSLISVISRCFVFRKVALPFSPPPPNARLPGDLCAPVVRPGTAMHCSGAAYMMRSINAFDFATFAFYFESKNIVRLICAV